MSGLFIKTRVRTPEKCGNGPVTVSCWLPHGKRSPNPCPPSRVDAVKEQRWWPACGHQHPGRRLAL